MESLATCKSVKLQDENGIILHWSETPVGESRPPTPLCIDGDDQKLQRRCIEEGFWETFEPQKCSFYALNKFSSCPYGMEKLKLADGDLCLLVTSPTKWKNSCLAYGGTKSVLDLTSDKFKVVMNHLKVEKQLSQFWLPAKRYQDYNPFQWQIAGSKWGETVDLEDYELEIDDNYKDGCLKLVMSGSNFALASESCEKVIPEVCVYDESSALKLACKNGFTSRFSDHQEKCFSVEKTSTRPTTKTLFQATNFYSRKFIKNLMDSFELKSKDRCLVDLRTVDNSQNFFTNNSYDYSVIDRNGKWSMDTKFTCAIYEEAIKPQLPEIYLKFDATSGKMFMIIYSEEFLWRDEADEPGAKCFTNSDKELVRVAKVKHRVWSETIKTYDMKLLDGSKSRNVSKSIYELKQYGKGPGDYWCEGHAIKSFKLIKSQRVVARKSIDGLVFAVTLESDVTITKDPIYDDDFLEDLSEGLKSSLKKSDKLNFYEKVIVNNIDAINVMKIVKFDKLLSRLTVIYHVTILNEFEESSEESVEYNDFMEKYAEKFNDVKVVINHQLMKFLERILKKVGESKFTFVSIYSTEYCLPMSIENPNPLTDILIWEQAKIGETLPPTELCVYKSGIPLTRKCEGDFLHGGQWQTLSQQDLQCVDKEILSLHTKRLFSFNKVISSNETHDIIENMTSISSHYDQLIPADIFYISKAVQQITNAANVTQSHSDIFNSMDLDDKYNLTIILNNIMNVNDSFIQLSQLKLNTTNILLDSYDNLINSLSTNYSIYATINNNLISNSLNETDGTFIMRTEKIVVFICDPGRMNVSGMALIRTRLEPESSLLDFEVVKLYASQTIDDVLNIYQESLEIASFFPEELLNRLDEIHQLETNLTDQPVEPLKIVIKVFYNDAIFKESSSVSSYKSQSKIISVSIPGHDQNLPLLLPIMFKKSTDAEMTDDDVCGYWEFQPNGTSSDSSEWMQQGCEFLGISKYDKSLALCGCSHLTHFAYLIMGTYVHDVTPGSDVIITMTDLVALDTITILGSTLSILGIIGIFITAICFRTWREKASTKVLLQLSLAIALQMILISFVSSEKHELSLDTASEKRSCVILGTSLHYSVLVTFSWMLITAFLQFKRYVIVLGNLKPERFFLKSFIIGWGSPLIPVVTVLTIDPYLYIPEIYGICYPQGLAFYFSVLLPIALIIIANLIVFILVIYNILKSGSSKGGSNRKHDHTMICSQLRVSVFLFFLLGLTWIFGLLAQSQTTILFSYLFCLTATIQGFVLFLYFIVMDPITRKLWRESFRTWTNKRRDSRLPKTSTQPSTQQSTHSSI